MTTFRAVGVRSTFAGLGEGDVPTYTCVVRILELTDDPVQERILGEHTFQVSSDLELKAECDKVLAELKAKHEATYLAFDITRKTIAEAESIYPQSARKELDAAASVKR